MLDPSWFPFDLGACTIDSVDDALVEVTWRDGHHSTYSIASLRLQCPCAVCRQRPSHGSLPMHPGSISLQGLRPVGRYAVALEFSDGHRTGIYSFEYLRSLCPCPECG